MHKSLNPIFAILAVVISFLLLVPTEIEPHNPLPGQGKTIVLQKEEDETQELVRREAWIENMHKAAPGTNWHEIERENLRNRYEAFLSRNLQKDINSVFDIAGGLLTGSWQEKGSNNNAGRSVCADYDTTDSKIYLGSDGGHIWKANFNGSNWEVLNDRFRIGGIQLVKKLRKNKANRIFVATDEKLTYYSDDEGDSWIESTGFDALNDWDERIVRTWVRDDSVSGIYSLVTERVAPSNQRVMSIYRSTDLGSSFERVISIPNTSNLATSNADMWVSAYGLSDVYVATGTQNYRFVPEGDTLFETGVFTDNIEGYTILTGHLHESGNTWLYAYVDSRILRSVDGGQNWDISINLDKNPFFKTSFTASVQTPDKLFFGDIECWRSVNGGQGWSKINDWYDYYDNINSKLHADIPMVSCLLNEEGEEFFIINTDGGPFYSPDGFQVNNIGISGLNIGQYYSVLTSTFDTNYVFLGAQDQGFQRAFPDDGGVLDFEQVVSGDYGHIVSSGEGVSIWMVYPGFAIFYPDASGYSDMTWDFDGSNTYWIPPLMPDPFLENVVYMGNGNRMTQLTQSGSSVTADNLPQVFAGPVSAMAFSPLDPYQWYAYTENGRFYHSEDAGASWTSASVAGGPGANYLYGACIYPSRVNPGEVWICGSGYSNSPVFKSENHGQTFTAVSDGLPSTMVFKMAGTPADEFIFAATEAGPYVFIKETQQWYELAGDDAPDQRYWDVEYIDAMKTARFVTYGRGAWDFRHTTLLSVNSPGKLPVMVYPNPANEFIRIQTNTADPISIRIFDLKGNLIKIASATADLTTIATNDLAAGVYLVEMRSGSQKSVERIVISH
ncbi:MAG: T9SS type A sorting domain-containing protein [Bacteroidetes bacterium]|nr:T9SS type A sorting domain-containing protein [Bacteroidota bacterium]